MSNQESPGGVSRRATTKIYSPRLPGAGRRRADPALYAAPRRGGGTTGYRRHNPHCLGRLLG